MEIEEKFARVLAESHGLRDNAPIEVVKPWMRDARLAAGFFEGYYGNELARLREKLSDALAAGGNHKSDCAVYNAPAFEPGPCDCGASLTPPTESGAGADVGRLSFRSWLVFCIEQACYNRDALDPKAAGMLTRVLERYDAAALASSPTEQMLREAGHDLAMAAGALVTATDGMADLREPRAAVLSALKSWERTLGGNHD